MTPDPVVTALRDFGDLKVWSLLVTLFGDAGAGPEAPIPGPDLSALFARLDIRPEALRVALHRLRKEGWIDSTKSGRVSLYHMTDTAQRETEAVRDFVYAPKLGHPSELWLWHLHEGVIPEDAVALGRTSCLAARKATDDGILSARIEASALPHWVTDTVTDERSQDAFLSLFKALEGDVDTEDTEVTRLLVLHTWRRLVLRQSQLGLAILPEDAPASRCRARVAAWLEALPQPAFTLQPSA